MRCFICCYAMKTKLYILLWMCCSVLLTACEGDDPKPEPPVYGSRTVLVYLAADQPGTGNNLNILALADLEEMKEGMKNLDYSDVHLLVYIDATGSTPRLVELVKKNGEVVENLVKSYEPRNSVGTAETMEVFNEVFSSGKFPADNYGLVYWSHGDGWVPNPLPSSRWVGQDTSNGTGFMNIADLVKVLKTAPHFDFILFDACFMQSIEVAYALRNYTDYLIGSPTEIPGPGARYDILVPAMFAKEDVALKTATAYYTPYEESYTGRAPSSNNDWTGGVSVGLLKSSELELLASMTNQVLTKIADKSELKNVFDYDKRSYNNPNYVGYYDMVDLMRLLTDASGFAAWKQAYDTAVPYWATTPKNYSGFTKKEFSMEGTNGVSHFIPSSSGSAINAAYRSTEWYKAAGLSKLGW